MNLKTNLSLPGALPPYQEKVFVSRTGEPIGPTPKDTRYPLCNLYALYKDGGAAPKAATKKVRPQQPDWVLLFLIAIGFFLIGLSVAFAIMQKGVSAPIKPSFEHQLVSHSVVAVAHPVVPESLPEADISSTASREGEIPPTSDASDAEESLSVSWVSTADTFNPPKTRIQKEPKRYWSYRVKPGETLSQLDPKNWQRTCAINKQVNAIDRRADGCHIVANATILLPVEPVAVAAASHLTAASLV